MANRIRITKAPETTVGGIFPLDIYQALIGLRFEITGTEGQFYIVDGDHYRAVIKRYRLDIFATMVKVEPKIATLAIFKIAKRLCAAVKERKKPSATAST